MRYNLVWPSLILLCLTCVTIVEGQEESAPLPPLPVVVPSRPFLLHDRPAYRNYAIHNYQNYPFHSSPYTQLDRQAVYSSLGLAPRRPTIS